MSRRRVVVLGIDAANPDLLLRWAGEGVLPHLGALLNDGVSGRIRGVQGFFIGSTWPSFYTGRDPARHGFHYLVQLRPGTYGFHRPADHGITRVDPVWRRLSRAGARQAILDVPLATVEPELNGVQIVEWGGHDSVYGFRARPVELERLIDKRWGAHPSGPSCDGRRDSASAYEAFTEALIAGVERKMEITRHVLGMEDWDLVVQVFTESHCAGHQMWHLHDPGHPAHQASWTGALGDPLRRVYVAIDRAIGQITSQARSSGRDPLILVVSPHGMDHWFGAQFLMRDILVALGVTAEEGDPAVDRGTPSWTVRGLIPDALKRPLRQVRGRLHAMGSTFRSERKTARLPRLGVDTGRSQCFPHPNGLAVGGIRLNRAGREPAGVLRPHEVESFCSDLTERLLEIRDADRGHSLVSRVLRTHDLYRGPYLDELPDLLVEWADSVPVGSTVLAGGRGATIRATSPRIGLVEGVNTFGRSGENRRDGLFVASGPGVPRGRREDPVSILDFAPTLCRLMGAEEDGFDGQAIQELTVPSDQ